MASLSQSLAKLRSPAVLVAQNGSSLALPNYMADEVEESRATIVAALCNTSSPLGGASRMPSRTSAAAQSREPASGSGILILGGSGAGADVDNDDDQEDNASRPMARSPTRSRRGPLGSPAQGQYVPQFNTTAADGSPRRPTSSTPPLPPSPRTHTPLVSFSDGSPRRQTTSASDSAAAATHSMLLRGVGGASSGISNHTRRPLSASATTQAQAPLDPFAAAHQQDLVAAVTGRIIQSYDYDDDSLDEEELECDLAAAQSTLARALEMARSGTTASLRSSGATTSDASTLSSRRSSVAAGAAGGGGASGGGGRLSTRYSTISQAGSVAVTEGEITPAAPAGGGGGSATSRQPQQQQPYSQRRASGGPCSATAAAAAAVAATAAADRHGELSQASSGSGRSGYGSWSAASAPPSPATIRRPIRASPPAGSSVLAGALSGADGAAAGVQSQSPSASGGGFGYPLRRALHLATAGGLAAQGDVEAGQGALAGGAMGGGGGAGTSGDGGSVGGGIGRFTSKESAARQTAAGGAAAAARGVSHSGGSGGLKGLLKLAKKAFRRSTGGAAVAAPPPLSLSDPDRPTAVSPVAVPRTPPATAGASQALGSPGSWTPGGGVGGALGREQSGVSSGRPLPASPVVTALATASRVSVAQQPYGRSSSSSTAASILAIRASPSSPPLSSPSSPPPPMSPPSSSPPPATPLSSTVSAPQASGASLSQQQTQPQLQSWSESGSGSNNGGRSPAFAPPASAPPLYAGGGGGGGGGATTSSQRRRSSTVSAGGGHVSELQVTAHVQSFMHYQQQMLQQQIQQQQQQQQQHQRGEQPLQQRLSNSFTVGHSGGGGAAAVPPSAGGGSGSRPGSAHGALSAAELGRSGGTLGSSRSASGEVGGDRESIGTRRSTPIWMSTGAAAAAAKTPYQPAGGGISGWQTAPALQVVPPMPPPPPSQPVKIISVGTAGAGGNPRWSPRSPASSCHVGSPLGPYYQQQLQQQKSYTLASQPTSPRTSCAHDSPPGGGGGGGGTPNVRNEDRTDRPLNTPPGSGPNSSPSPTALELQQSQQQEQQQQYFPNDMSRGVRTSRTSPTVPAVLQRGAADGWLSPAGGGAAAASAPTSPASPRSSLSGMANGTSGGGSDVGKPPPSFGVAGPIG